MKNSKNSNHTNTDKSQTSNNYINTISSYVPTINSSNNLISKNYINYNY